jgi:hypothetical protein
VLAGIDTSTIYDGYLDFLRQYHSMPVVAVGFGVSSSRGTEVLDRPPLTELEQGHALAAYSTELERLGWAGGFISSWQDSWQRRTWNTIFASNPWRYPYWHNLQSVSQGYGLLAFDPGRYTRPVILDGLAGDWDETHLVYSGEGLSVYAQYTLDGLYLMVRGESVTPEGRLYVPIDTIPGSGTSSFGDARFDRPADFLLVIDGTDGTRLMVDRRYHVTYQRFLYELFGLNAFVDVPQDFDSGFIDSQLAVMNPELVGTEEFLLLSPEGRELLRLGSWPTGWLTHGNGDPSKPDFNSLTDFAFGDGLVEVRLPWRMINFFDPSLMQVHDDHFDEFGVTGMTISELHVGVGRRGLGTGSAGQGEIQMHPVELSGWGNRVEYHERLKQSYFVIQELWTR